MSKLQRTIAEKEQAIRQQRRQLRIQRAELGESVHATLTSPAVIASGFAAGLAFALLRCRGESETLQQTLRTDAAPMRSLEWLLRHIGPPIALTLMHRYLGEEAAADDDE